MSTISPNMGLIEPGVGTTPGPEWASELNTTIQTIDAHSHTSGSGVLIATAALNINGDLTFNSHAAIDLNSLVLESLSADVSTATSVYVKNGELFYIDDSANVVQLTDNGSVAGATGTIGGMGSIPPFISPSVTFSAANKDYTFNYQSSLTARLNIGDIHLYPFDGGVVPYSDYVNLKANTALGVQYDWTFPLAHPSKTSPLIWSGAGQVDDIELNDGQFLIGSTAGAVAAGSIAGTANQVTVTNAANLITLSLPQDIATASSPTFATVATTTRFTTAGGSQGSPSYRFTADTNTGIYNPGADILGITAAGTLVASFDASGIDVVGDIVASDDLIAGDTVFASLGAEASPSFSFTGDTDTGIWSNTANEVNIATGGTNRISINSTAISSSEPFQGPSGSVGAPTYSFSANDATGMYYPGSNTIMFSSNAADQLSINTVRTTVFGDLRMDSGGFFVDLQPTTYATAGAVVGYLYLNVNGTIRKIPYHAFS
jgi:hypothetical protein